MLLRLIRSQYAPTGTVGRLYVDGQSFCDTLEPPYGTHTGPSTMGKLPSRTEAKKLDSKHLKGCVPLGFYKVAITMSPRFHRPLPLLYYVPGYEGIRIHPGGELKNTSGCILVGVCSPNAVSLRDSEGLATPPLPHSTIASLAVDGDPTMGLKEPHLTGSRQTSDTLNSLILKAQKDHEDIFISIEEQDAYPLADSVCPPEQCMHYIEAQCAIQDYYERHPQERPSA